MKPICVPCRRFFRPIKNGFTFIEGMPDSSEAAHLRGKAGEGHWKPYKLWEGDKWKCPDCGAEIVVGTGREPIREHYQDDFEAVRVRLGGEYQVNDC